MIEFDKMNMIEKQSLKFNLSDNLFSLKLDSKIIGYGKVTDNYNNRIEIYIEQDYRGNGYGKILFEKMIDVIKNLNLNDVHITSPKQNIQMKKIITDFGGKQVSIDDEIVQYILPLKA